MRSLILLAGLLGLPVVAVSQEPVPEPDLELPGPDDGRPEVPPEVEKAVRLLEEIRTNMREIERLLERQDTGDANQSTQVRTLERIEELIEVMNKT